MAFFGLIWDLKSVPRAARDGVGKRY